MRVHAELDLAGSLVEQLVACVSAADDADDDALLQSLALVGRLVRATEAIGVRLAADVAARSSDSTPSLANRLGERNAGALVASTARVSPRTAANWVGVGSALAPRTTLTGEPLPSAHPSVDAAVATASVSPPEARTILSTVAACALDVESAHNLEQVLVEHAAQLSERELSRLCREVVGRLQPEDAVEREEFLRARSGLRIVQLPDGITRFIVDAHPEAAGFLTAALDARTAPRRRPRFEQSGDSAQGAPEDPADNRPAAQQRLDALVSIARESLAHDPGDVSGTSVTMVVTVGLDELRTGLGEARIEGVDAPISASTARRLAASADIIPAVLGTDSEVLDLGRKARLFSAPQRRALAQRDGGCAWPGCTAPPGWCEIAHLLAWFLGGRTDLANGLLLCPFHHRRLDNDGWSVEWTGGVPYFIPPSWVDSTRTPRRGGRLPRIAA
jgi:hypothetical protein